MWKVTDAVMTPDGAAVLSAEERRSLSFIRHLLHVAAAQMMQQLLAAVFSLCATLGLINKGSNCHF